MNFREMIKKYMNTSEKDTNVAQNKQNSTPNDQSTEPAPARGCTKDYIVVGFKCYNLDILSDIQKIPARTGSNAYYVLQRTATKHKKSGNLPLAIACLRKSNELSDYLQAKDPRRHAPLLQKDYIRLVKYIELLGDHALAEQELSNLYNKHPEFADKRFSNLVGIRSCLARAREHKTDFVLISTNKKCPICSKYNQKVYSISGKSKKYPALPAEIKRQGGLCPNCIIGMNPYYESINN